MKRQLLERGPPSSTKIGMQHDPNLSLIMGAARCSSQCIKSNAQMIILNCIRWCGLNTAEAWENVMPFWHNVRYKDSKAVFDVQTLKVRK